MRNPVLIAVLLLCSSQVSARTLSDGDFGYHVSNDPLDQVGDSYRVSVRHCRALEEAIGVLRDRHGWLIALEEPVVVYPGDLVTVTRLTDGEYNGECMRPVELAVDYSSTDPLQAVQAVVSAYNAASPAFTAKVAWCGGNLCVTGDTAKSPEGSVVAATSAFDTPVTVVGTTRRDFLKAALEQVEQATGTVVKAAVPGGLGAFLDQPAGFAPGQGVAAREILAQLAHAYNQDAFETAWTERQQREAQTNQLDMLGKVHGQFVGYAHRQGKTEAEAAEEWNVLRAKLEAQLAEDPGEPPSYTPGVGPGLAWDLGVRYDRNDEPTYWFRLGTILDPSLIPRFRALPGTVPSPGADSDGDGVSDPVDQCDGSPSGELVLWTGCTVQQTCPCGAAWSNNGEYNGCVRDAVNTLVQYGTLSKDQKVQYQNGVKQSGCGQ